MQRITAVLAAGAFLLLAGLPANVVAQSPRTQELTFGGGSHFDFVVPVMGAGRVSVEIELPAAVPVEAILFSAQGHDYATRARGIGSLSLSHAIAVPADGEWRLDIVLPPDRGDVVGTLKITWPADNARDDVVAWLNAGPTDPQALANVADALARMERDVQQTNGGPGLDPDVVRITGVVQARLDALSGTPARYNRTDCGMEAVDDVPLTVAAGSGPLSVSLVEFASYEQGPWHPGRNADRSYVVAAVLPEPGGTAVGGQSRIYRFMGTDPYGHRVKPVKITHPTGEALLLPGDEGLPSGQLLVAVFEREHAVNGTSLQEFLHGAELFAILREIMGQDADRHLSWLMDLALGRGDGIVGMPRLITVRRDGTGTAVADREIRFTQNDADYAVTIRVVAANPAR